MIERLHLFLLGLQGPSQTRGLQGDHLMLMLSFPNNGVGFLEPIFTVAATKSFIVSAFCAWHKSAMEIEWSKFELCWVLSFFFKSSRHF